MILLMLWDVSYRAACRAQIIRLKSGPQAAHTALHAARCNPVTRPQAALHSGQHVDGLDPACKECCLINSGLCS